MANFDYRKALKKNKSTFFSSLTEGQFSWMTQDTDNQIGSEDENQITVYMHDDKGNTWKEAYYEGYGEFGGKDYYELVAEMNGYTKDDIKKLGGPFPELRSIGIKLAFGELEPKNGGPVLFPALTEDPRYPNGHDFTQEAENDPNQSWYSPKEEEDEDEDDNYSWEDQYGDEEELDEGKVEMISAEDSRAAIGMDDEIDMDRSMEEGFLDRLSANIKGVTSKAGATVNNLGAFLKGDKDAIKDPKLAQNMAMLKQKTATLDKELADAMSDIDKLFPKDVVAQTSEEFQTLLSKYISLLNGTKSINQKIASGDIASIGMKATNEETKSVNEISVRENEDTSGLAEKFAQYMSNKEGRKFTVTAGSVDEKSFDLDLDGMEYEGGSYLVKDNGDIVNVAAGNEVYGNVNQLEESKEETKSNKMTKKELKEIIKAAIMNEGELEIGNMEDAPESEVDFLSETNNPEVWKMFDLIRDNMDDDQFLQELIAAMDTDEAMANLKHIIQMYDLEDYGLVSEAEGLTPLQDYVYQYEIEISNEDFANKELENIKKLNTPEDVYNYYAVYRGWEQDKDLKYELKNIYKQVKRKFANLTTSDDLTPLQRRAYNYTKERFGDEEAKNSLDQIKTLTTGQEFTDWVNQKLKNLNEAEVETEEEVDVDVEAPEPTDEPMGGIDVTQNADADLTGVEKEVQDNLEAAMEAAKKLEDEKLTKQIGNSLTFFTRQHVVKENNKKYYKDAEADDAEHIKALEKDMKDDKKSSEKLQEAMFPMLKKILK